MPFKQKYNSEYIKCLLHGENVPTSWETAGYDFIRRRILNYKYTIQALKGGRNYKFYKESLKVKKIQKDKETAASKPWKPVPDHLMEKAFECTRTMESTAVIPMRTHGSQASSFGAAIKDALLQRRQNRVRAAVQILNLSDEVRQKKIAELRQHMTNLTDILNILSNLKCRDLKSRSAISAAGLRNLKQDCTGNSILFVKNRQNSELMRSFEELGNGKNQEGSIFSKVVYSPAVPLWQALAAESGDSTSWSSIPDCLDSQVKDSLVDRIVFSWNQVRAKQARDTQGVIKSIERRNIERFKILNLLLHKSFASFEQFYIKAKVAYPEKLSRIRSEKNVGKLTWLFELEEQCLNFKNTEPTLEFPELKILQKLAKTDFPEIPFVRAKLCLYVMSLPAYIILKREIQKSILSVLTILFLPQSLLREWLAVRHLPLMIAE